MSKSYSGKNLYIGEGGCFAPNSIYKLFSFTHNNGQVTNLGSCYINGNYAYGHLGELENETSALMSYTSDGNRYIGWCNLSKDTNGGITGYSVISNNYTSALEYAQLIGAKI